MRCTLLLVFTFNHFTWMKTAWEDAHFGHLLTSLLPHGRITLATTVMLFSEWTLFESILTQYFHCCLIHKNTSDFLRKIPKSYDYDSYSVTRNRLTLRGRTSAYLQFYLPTRGMNPAILQRSKTHISSGASELFLVSKGELLLAKRS